MVPVVVVVAEPPSATNDTRAPVAIDDDPVDGAAAGLTSPSAERLAGTAVGNEAPVVVRVDRRIVANPGL